MPKTKKFKKIVEWNFDSSDFFILIGINIAYCTLIGVMSSWFGLIGFLISFSFCYLLLLVSLLIDKETRKVTYEEIK